VLLHVQDTFILRAGDWERNKNFCDSGRCINGTISVLLKMTERSVTEELLAE
jgi:hypothetical protein